MHMQCWGLIAEKSTQQKTCKSKQNGFDCSEARTPVVRCTTGTMYHWASQADNIKVMMDYIPHVIRYIPTYTYRYLYIRTYTCIYLHIHAHTCTYMLNLGAPEHPKYASDFGARGCVLHNAVGRTNDPSLSLPGRSWPILRPWQHGT